MATKLTGCFLFVITKKLTNLGKFKMPLTEIYTGVAPLFNVIGNIASPVQYERERAWKLINELCDQDTGKIHKIAKSVIHAGIITRSQCWALAYGAEKLGYYVNEFHEPVQADPENKGAKIKNGKQV